MKGELHITMDWPIERIEEFKSACAFAMVKPIVIELEQTNGDKYIQVMTSGICDLEEIHEKAYDWRHLAEVKRIKFEIQPGTEEHTAHLYYESHLRLKLEKNSFNEVWLQILKDKIRHQTSDWHFSKNLFKKDESYVYQMITYRSYTDNNEQFMDKVKQMLAVLNSIQIRSDKLEIEECIYDSNISLDNLWLNTKE